MAIRFFSAPSAGLAAGLALTLAAPAVAQQQTEPPAASQQNTPGSIEDQAPASFINTDGEQVGTANLTDVPSGGLLLSIQIVGMPPEQWVGFHVHENGECNPEDGFESAGGHFNPDGREHGFYVEGGPHAGDMPNQYVSENGILRAWVYNHMVSLDGDEPSVRGRALMIHGGQDDYESQPSGDAGNRIACAVIE